MKLFKYESRTEGQVLSLEAIVVFGKKYDYPDIRNGWYLLINLPFLTRHIPDYIDPRTFTTGPALCFWRFYAVCRKIRGNEKYAIVYSQAWCLTEYLSK